MGNKDLFFKLRKKVGNKKIDYERKQMGYNCTRDRFTMFRIWSFIDSRLTSIKKCASCGDRAISAASVPSGTPITVDSTSTKTSKAVRVVNPSGQQCRSNRPVLGNKLGKGRTIALVSVGTSFLFVYNSALLGNLGEWLAFPCAK